MVKSFKSYMSDTPYSSIKGVDYNLPEPPANSSKKTIMELELLEKISRHTKPEDDILIKKYDNKTFESFIEILDDNNLTYDIKEIKSLMGDIDTIVTEEKFKFNRPRPTKLAEKFGYELKDVYYKESVTSNTPTYPSMHSTQSRFLTSYLSEMHPSYKSIFLKLSEEISFSRIRGLLHYPTDVLAGEILGQIIYERYSKNKDEY